MIIFLLGPELWCWEELGAGGEGYDRGWDGRIALPAQWTWVWGNSGGLWWSQRPGVLWFMVSQRVGHDWATELNWTVCILDSLKPFEEIGNVTRLRKAPETFKRCFYSLLNSFGWFVCVRVKTFNSKFVRNVSQNFLFVQPLCEFDIEQYWPHQISWECFPTLLLSWGDYVKLFLIFKIFVRILWSNYHGLMISFSNILYYIFNLFKCYRTIQKMYLILLQVFWDYIVWSLYI